MSLSNPVLRYLITFCALWVIIREISSQENFSTRSVIIEDLIEQIARDQEEELDYTTLFSDLAWYLENPLDPNSASREEFEKLHLLTDFQIASLQQYILDKGPMLSIYELPMVYGFNEEFAHAISPLLRFDPLTASRQSAPAAKAKSQHQLYTRISGVIEEQKGYGLDTSSQYLGNRIKFYTRYAYRYGNKISAGYTGEKDAGETFFTGNNKRGFDFNSAHVRINDLWKFKSIVAGDYQVKVGQGLNLWSGLAVGKSPDVLNISRKSDVLNPYSSTDENRFFRGVSATLQHSDFQLSTFFSSKKVDANIVPGGFSSLQETGLHTIPREVEDKDAVKETILGAHLGYRRDHLKVGALVSHYFFDANWENGPGSSNTNLGLDYMAGFNRINFFGEAAISENGGFALLNGASADLGSQVTFSMLHRYFRDDFHSLYGNAFSESSNNSNEHGLYTGIQMHPFTRWTFSAYLDAFVFPWLKNQVSAPSSGFDYHLQADYFRKEGVSAYIRIIQKSRPENLKIDTAGINPVVLEKTSRIRFHIAYPVATHLEFQNRLELSLYQKEGEKAESGYSVFHDILYRPENFPFSFSLRYNMFDTDGYNSRIYSYEHDVLYAFSIPSFFDRGIRTYLNIRWEINGHVDLWFKYALTWYSDRQTIGSGLNEIEGNTRSDVRLMLRLKI